VRRGWTDENPTPTTVASGRPDPPNVEGGETKTEHRSARELREPAPPRAALEREYLAIYTREYPVALRFASQYVDRASAEDAVQTVFMKYWEGYTRTPPLVFRADGAHIQAAILAAVRNELRSSGKRAKTREDKRPHVRTELVARLRQTSAPDRVYANLALANVVIDAVAALPDRQQEVFMAVRADSKSYEEVATELGISTKTVHQHLARATARLRELLPEHRVPEDGWSWSLHDDQVVPRTKQGQE
jgi:RNA polymerase sigma-70 factor (ECF subfamily)